VSRRRQVNLWLTQRALADLRGIYDFSVNRWGKRVADTYLNEIEAAMERVRAEPALLRSESDLPAGLAFYRVNRHLLVCDAETASIVVLTVVHASQDVPARLAEMQPTLAAEVQLLHRRLRATRHKE
jgi:toxin ParE1/3/4